jgi:HEPN domain-containing protein
MIWSESQREFMHQLELLNASAKITPAYSTTRYPDVGRVYDRGDVEEILMSAKEVLEWVKKNLNS